jgi:hypothetical protein
MLMTIDWRSAIHILRALADDFPGNFRFLTRSPLSREPVICIAIGALKN